MRADANAVKSTSVPTAAALRLVVAAAREQHFDAHQHLAALRVVLSPETLASALADMEALDRACADLDAVLSR